MIFSLYTLFSKPFLKPLYQFVIFVFIVFLVHHLFSFLHHKFFTFLFSKSLQHTFHFAYFVFYLAFLLSCVFFTNSKTTIIISCIHYFHRLLLPSLLVSFFFSFFNKEILINSQREWTVNASIASHLCGFVPIAYVL